MTPGARDLLLRSEAARRAGFPDFANADLEAAARVDPNDPLVNAALLNFGPPSSRVRAARLILRGLSVERSLLVGAIELLITEGAGVLTELDWTENVLTGWVAWDRSARVEMRVEGEFGESRRWLEGDPEHRLRGEGHSVCDVELGDESGLIRSVDFLLAERIVARAPPPPPREGEAIAFRSAIESDATARVNVIVPAYENYEATVACLESLAAQRSKIEMAVVVVDDASPNARLSAVLHTVCANNKWAFVRNNQNLGFAGAVNRALRGCGAGDVLLVNADTLLPPGAIDRLAEAARSAPGIGTVTPFSNNGEFTSYPRPNEVNPTPSMDEILKTDEAALRANGGGVVDLPNGIGFCLYITRACLDRVGPFSLLYSRGYYEDAEFCLKVREAGFRNVCATGVFVGHHGSLSFASEKRSLVMRNLEILESRFPHHQRECASFLEADPLRRARGAIDAAAPPLGPTTLSLSHGGASSAQAERRARGRGGEEEVLLHVVADRAGRSVSIRRDGQGAPYSLRFALDDENEVAGLRAYFAALTIRRVEIFEASAIPDPLLDKILEIDARVELICADLDWFRPPIAPRREPCEDLQAEGPCEACARSFLSGDDSESGATHRRRRLSRALTRAEVVRPLDRMSEAFAQRVFKEKSLAIEEAADALGAEAPAGAALGVISPVVSAQADALIMRLARGLERRGVGGKVVVLGRGVDDLALMSFGNVFVTGRVAPEEYRRALIQYDVGALVSPYRTSQYGVLDEAAQAAGAPKAYFDWSFGGMRTDDGDLALDPRICDEKAAEAIAFWFEAIYRTRAV